MPTTYKLLAQQGLSANTAADLYTVPAGTQAIISSIIIHNYQSGGLSLWIVKSGESPSAKNRILNAITTGFDTHNNYTLNLGITLNAGDKIRGEQGNFSGNLVFHISGVEIS